MFSPLLRVSLILIAILLTSGTHTVLPASEYALSNVVPLAKEKVVGNP